MPSNKATGCGYLLYTDVNALSHWGGPVFLDLTGIECLMNLNSLFISADNLTELTPISSLINLTELTLFADHFSDLTLLAGLINLTGLSLNNTTTTLLTSRRSPAVQT